MTRSPERVVVVGAGKVARQLVPWLKSKGVEVVQVYNRHLEAAGALASEVGAAAIDDLKELDTGVQLVFIAVSDDAIANVSGEMPRTDAVVVHTSGTRPITDLEHHEKRGVFYPLQTFSEEAQVDFQQVPVCIESSDDVVSEVLKSCGIAWGLQMHELDSGQREVLHVAAVIANNFTNHLLGKSFDLLKTHNIAPDILYPLLMETIRKAVYNDPHAIQTGPAVRGDERTVQRHLDKLKDDPALREIYRQLTDSILQTHRHGKL